MDWNNEYINQYLQGKIIKYPHEQFFKDNNTDYTTCYFLTFDDIITNNNINYLIQENININPYITLTLIQIYMDN